MPPKYKFTRDEIIEASMDLIRENGWNALTARTLAERLGASTRPIYSYFKSMAELDQAIAQKTVEMLYHHMIQERTGDPWHDHGIGYVLFAQAEKALFRGINDEKRIHFFKQYGDVIWDQLTASLQDYPPFQGLTPDQVYRIQLTRWLFAQGLAFQLCDQQPDIWDRENIVLIMRQGSTAICEGMKRTLTDVNP